MITALFSFYLLSSCGLSPPQNAAERTAHDGPTNGSADGTTNGLSEIGGKPARNLVDHIARDLARDILRGRQPLVARACQAENAADQSADLAQHRTDTAGLRCICRRLSLLPDGACMASLQLLIG